MMKAASRKIVTFSLGEDIFGAEVDQVERVLRFKAPTPLPEAPDWMLGAMEYGGRPVPVVDMRRRLTLPAMRPKFLTRIIIFMTPSGPVGGVVDAVLDMARVADADLRPPPELYRGISGTLLRGIVSGDDGLMLVLDAASLLSSHDRIIFERSIATEEAPAHG